MTELESSEPVFTVRQRVDGIEANGPYSFFDGHRLATSLQASGEGAYAQWAWDGRTLTAEVDRLGLFPLFYRIEPDGLVISPSLVALARSIRDLRVDPVALGAFLKLGFYLGEDTPFEGVHTLPAGGRLTWEGTAQMEVCSLPAVSSSPAWDDAIDQYNALLDAAIARRATDLPFALPLSGGRDSRRLALDLLRHDLVPQTTVTCSGRSRKSGDVEPARRLSRALGLDHRVVPPGDEISCEREKNIWTHLCSDEHAWQVPLRSWLSGRYPVIYDGLGGGALGRAAFESETRLRLFREGRLNELAESLMPGEIGTFYAMLPEEITRGVCDIDQRVLGYVTGQLNRYAGDSGGLRRFFFFSRSRREIALSPFGMYRGVVSALCPFVDTALVAFLMAQPTEMLRGTVFFDQAAERVHPEYRCVPFADDDDEPEADIGHRLAYGADAGCFALLTDARWTAVLGRTAFQLARMAVNRDRRDRELWLSPPRLLYLAQIMRVLRNRNPLT